MRARRQCFRCLSQAFFLLLPCLATAVFPQAKKTDAGQKPQQSDHTIRVDVGLVQTDVMVFDRQGRFVPELKLGQFELRVDGKVQPISFVEQVSAGSPHDEEVWARAEGKPVPAPALGVDPRNPGRILLFYLDDWHLSADSVMRSRAALANLVNTSMGPKDRVGVFTATGQLGPVRQLTGDKAAVQAELEKFNFVSAGVADLEYPPMTEAQAVLIEQNDADVINYFAKAIAPTIGDRYLGALGGINDDRELNKAKEIARKRAAGLAQQSATYAERSLAALRNLFRSTEDLPGRKLVFLLSDGFVIQPQRGDIVARIREVTDAAARTGFVVYTLDARGLVVGLPDATRKRAPDTTGSLAHSGVNEVSSAQDALNALAADTGGRFLKNTNALDAALITTLEEISRYYLLAWSIDQEQLRPGKYSTIRASVKGRPDLSVRVRQGWLDLSRLVFKSK
jgi:VWFA-related protein